MTVQDPSLVNTKTQDSSGNEVLTKYIILQRTPPSTHLLPRLNCTDHPCLRATMYEVGSDSKGHSPLQHPRNVFNVKDNLTDQFLRPLMAQSQLLNRPILIRDKSHPKFVKVLLPPYPPGPNDLRPHHRYPCPTVIPPTTRVTPNDPCPSLALNTTIGIVSDPQLEA